MAPYQHAPITSGRNGDEKIPGLRDGKFAAAAQAVFHQIRGSTRRCLLRTSHGTDQSRMRRRPRTVVERTLKLQRRPHDGRVWPVALSRPWGECAALWPGKSEERSPTKVYKRPQWAMRPASDDGLEFFAVAARAAGPRGREGYARLAKATGLDPRPIIPTSSTIPSVFLECGVRRFLFCAGCFAVRQSRDVFARQQGGLNGGTVGLAQRQMWLCKMEGRAGARGRWWCLRRRPAARKPRSPCIPQAPRPVSPPPVRPRRSPMARTISSPRWSRHFRRRR